MLYLGNGTNEVVWVKNYPTLNELWTLVYSKNGLGWYAPAKKLVELTPLMEALC